MSASVFFVLMFWCMVEAFNSPSFLKSTRVNLRCVRTENAPFVDALVDASASIQHRFFFPGHNGGNYGSTKFKNVLEQKIDKLDLPELDELDNIHDPQSSLKESLGLTAKLFDALQSWFLLNGSTSGVHIAMMTLKRWYKLSKRSKCKAGNPFFLVPRDSHKSVFDGLKLSNTEAVLLPHSLDKDFDVSVGIDLDQLKKIVHEKHAQIVGVILTRPTYQGIMTSGPEFQSAIEYCHKFGVPVLVDEAHGSHLAFLQQLQYADALSCGADFVVQSSHKTLTSLTQTALLHIGKKGLFQDELIQSHIAQVTHSYYSMLTTTSPNALLLASLDAAQAYFTACGRAVVTCTAEAVAALKNRLCSIDMVSLLEHSQTVRDRGLLVDPLRLSVRYRHPSHPHLTSAAIDERMYEDHGICCELNLPSCITYILPPGLTTNHSDVLERAIRATNDQLKTVSNECSTSPSPPALIFSSKADNVTADAVPSRLVTEEFMLEQEMIPEIIGEKLLGMLSGESVIVYPPGIPVVLTGEQITAPHLQALLSIQQRLPFENDDQVLLGNSDPLLKTLLCCPAPRDNTKP